MSIEAANRVLDEALDTGPRCGGCHVIAIDGPAGSGKTTFAAEIADVARERSLTCRVLHTDEVCPGWDGLRAVPAIIEAVLRDLATGASARYPTWDWHANHPGPDTLLLPADVVLIEGVGSGARRCVPYLSQRILLDAPTALRKQRALARDGDTFAPHWERWAAAEADYFGAEWS